MAEIKERNDNIMSEEKTSGVHPVKSATVPADNKSASVPNNPMKNVKAPVMPTNRKTFTFEDDLSKTSSRKKSDE